MSTLHVCLRGHVSTECDTHDVVEMTDSHSDRPAIYEAYLERSCVDCGSLVEEVVACEMCGEAPAADGSDRCESCEVAVASEEAAEARRAELRKALIDIARVAA